jgi:hypothetical protein
MQWSKLKTRVRSFICPELRDRIDFYVTSYRKSHDEADKLWITVDGRRVFCCKHYPHHRARVYAYYCGLSLEGAKSALREVEIFHPTDFGNAMRDYLDLPLSRALKSSDPFIKAFALVDRRLGKRTLERLELSDSEHALVKEFHELRLAAAHA